jgi:hypothetical protein
MEESVGSLMDPVPAGDFLTGGAVADPQLRSGGVVGELMLAPARHEKSPSSWQWQPRVNPRAIPAELHRCRRDARTVVFLDEVEAVTPH